MVWVYAALACIVIFGLGYVVGMCRKSPASTVGLLVLFLIAWPFGLGVMVGQRNTSRRSASGDTFY